jgi:outer membrane protein OmpA-like peptidoglycan-associated protein
MKKLILFFTLTILSSFAVFAQKAKKAEVSVTELKEYASLYIEDDDYESALPVYKALDSLEKRNSNNPFMIGVCMMNTGRQLKASTYFERAKKEGCKDPKLFNYLGHVNHLNHKFDIAIEFYEKYKNALRKADPAYDYTIFETNNLIQQCKTGKQLTSVPLSVNIENIGNTINTIYPEYVPLISADEKTLFFTSRRPTGKGGKLDDNDNMYFEDIFISRKEGVFWSQPKSIGDKINTKRHDACVGINPNGKTLFLYKPDKKVKEGISGDIYQSDFIDNDWTTPVRLNDNINTNYWEPSACISFDEFTLYFSSNRPGGFGGLDIYKSSKVNGEWGPAVNLGPTVNTPLDDDAPFIHSDNKTLYFSSKGHQNMGDYDIFYTVIDPTTQAWSNPENIGYPLNSADHDIYFSWNRTASKAYFSSFRSDTYGEKDIYTATRIVNDTALIAVKGFVLDTITGKPVAASIAFFDLSNGKIVANFNSDTIHGNYLVELKKGKSYKVKVISSGYFYKEDIINIDALGSLIEYRKNFKIRHLLYNQAADDVAMKNVGDINHSLSKSELKQLAKRLHASDTSADLYKLKDYRNKFRVGDKLEFDKILFEENKFDLTSQSIAELEELYGLMRSYPEIIVEISGHTDSLGKHKHNVKLSKKRSKIVVNYLIKRGIDKKRLQAKGYAEADPITTNNTDEGRHLNRRTEFTVIRHCKRRRHST